MWVRLWRTIDKWGPAATAGICLSVVAVLGWWYSSRISYERGVNEAQQSQINQVSSKVDRETNELRKERKAEIEELSSEIENLRNWSIAVYERASRSGLDIPPIPERKNKNK